MNRRRFFQRLLGGAAAVSVAPMLPTVVGEFIHLRKPRPQLTVNPVNPFNPQVMVPNIIPQALIVSGGHAYVIGELPSTMTGLAGSEHWTYTHA